LSVSSSIALGDVGLGDVGAGAETEAEAVGDVVGDGVDIVRSLHLHKVLKIGERKGPGRAGGKLDALYSVE
jgi:hypothetical protein